MQKGAKLKKAVRRVAQTLERSGFRISFCAGLLSEVFDITADSIYSPARDSGLYIAIGIDTISKELLDAILNYGTPRKKEIWILKHGGSSTSPGFFLIFRIDGRRIVESPKNWPIEKVMSSPKKWQAALQKKRVSPAKTGSQPGNLKSPSSSGL